LKKWRVLYEGIQPHAGSVATYRVLLDPLKVPSYVERALRNSRQKTKLGPLQIRIVKGATDGEGKDPGAEVQLRSNPDARRGVLYEMRKVQERRPAAKPTPRTAAPGSKNRKGKR
jgi:hypothetical protein